MIRWSNLSRKAEKSSSACRRRTTLRVEALERRDCPSAPQITAFTVSVQAGNTVLLSGKIMDSNPTAAHVCFGGVGSGSVTPNSLGNFQLQENLPQLGTVSATAYDPNGMMSGTAQNMVTDPGLSLRLSVTPGANGNVTVTGQVSGNSPVGLAVTLSGVVSGATTTSANGTFTFIGPASGPGQIQAAVTDDWGVTVTSSTMLTDSPPQIVSFQAVNNGGNCWTFMGQVQGPDVAGLIVTLCGLPSLASNDASAVVQTNGSFTYTINLQPGENGCVTAECIDWWGEASNEATAFVWS